jgi:hypothetical protein
VHVGARGGEQAGNAIAISREFERVHQAPGNAPQQNTYRLQSAQGFQVQAFAAHGEIAALDQIAGQFARQQDVAIPTRICMARRQQRGATGTLRRQALQYIGPMLHERIERAQLLCGEDLRHHASQTPAIFQRMRQPVGPIGSVGRNLPCAIGRADHVGGVVAQEPSRRCLPGAAAGTQETGVGVNQCRRQGAEGEEALLAVDVAQNCIQ